MITQHMIGIIGIAALASTAISGYLTLALLGVGFLLSLLPAK